MNECWIVECICSPAREINWCYPASASHQKARGIVSFGFRPIRPFNSCVFSRYRIYRKTILMPWASTHKRLKNRVSHLIRAAVPLSVNECRKFYATVLKTPPPPFPHYQNSRAKSLTRARWPRRRVCDKVWNWIEHRHAQHILLHSPIKWPSELVRQVITHRALSCHYRPLCGRAN